MNLPVPLKYWTTVRQGLLAALDQVTDEQLVFVPREGLWSLGQVALHIADAEEGWFRHVVTGELKDWPADHVLADHATVEAVKQILNETHARTEAYLASLDEAGLEQVVAAPWGATFPVRWVIWHVLEHEISHRGEIYLMLGLLGMEAPDV